jgi:hypothetical protein
MGRLGWRGLSVGAALFERQYDSKLFETLIPKGKYDIGHAFGYTYDVSKWGTVFQDIGPTLEQEPFRTLPTIPGRTCFLAVKSSTGIRESRFPSTEARLPSNSWSF